MPELEDDEQEVTLEKVKAFFERNKENPEVTEYITSISVDKPLTPEVVTGYLQTTEGKMLIQPMFDQRVTDAIKTHDIKMKAANEAAIKAGINAEIARMNPAETAEQRRIRELEQSVEANNRKWEQERLEANIAMEAAKRGIPLELYKDIPYPSIDHAINTFTVYEQKKQKDIEKAINEKMAIESFKPKSSQGEKKSGMTFSEFAALPLKQREKMAETGEIDNLIPD